MESKRPRQYFLAFKLERYNSGKLKTIEILVGWTAVIAFLLLTHGLGWVSVVGPLLGHLK